MTETTENKRGVVKTREGFVVSNKMNKTAVIEITKKVKHKFYGKYVKRTLRYLAHDEHDKCDIGDKVRIIETKPMSKNKRWRVQEVLEKHEQA